VHGLKWKSYFATLIPLFDDCEVLNLGNLAFFKVALPVTIKKLNVYICIILFLCCSEVLQPHFCNIIAEFTPHR